MVMALKGQAAAQLAQPLQGEGLAMG